MRVWPFLCQLKSTEASSVGSCQWPEQRELNDLKGGGGGEMFLLYFLGKNNNTCVCVYYCHHCFIKERTF